MDDPVFDAVFALCQAAEEQGFTAVADALELVLDVYLMEKQQLDALANPMFKSSRISDEIAVWEADRQADTGQIAPMASDLGWSMSTFPLLRVR